jgi:hypothetical protein
MANGTTASYSSRAVAFKAATSGGASPTTSVTSPGNGAAVSGTITVSATASDSVGVTLVQFYLDGAVQTTDTASPYTWSWNTASSANGSHTLYTVAYDAAGYTGTSPTVTVTVNN